jgi:Thiolase, C-terminal domain
LPLALGVLWTIWSMPSALGGRVPVNPDGGLVSRGHPVGATGCAQLVELVTLAWLHIVVFGDPGGGAQLVGDAVQLAGSCATAGLWHGAPAGMEGCEARHHRSFGTQGRQAKYGGALPLGLRGPPRHQGALAKAPLAFPRVAS